MDKSIGDHIRAWRLKQGMSAADFIKRVNHQMSTTYLCRIELSRLIPSPSLLCKLADAIDVHPRMLLEIALKQRMSEFGMELYKRQEDALHEHLALKGGR